MLVIVLIMSKITLATFNVNSIRSRLHVVIPWLQKHQPDFLCMQETRVDNEQFPEDPFTDIGYYVSYSGSEGGRNGVAIASRVEPEAISSGLIDKPHDKDRLLQAKFRDIIIVNTYVPQGYRINNPKYQYKLEWFMRLKNYFQQDFSMKELLIWCGDLNVAPLDIDVHDPQRLRNHVCFHKDVKEMFDDVKSLGFKDVFRKHHPDESNQYTFFDYRTSNAVEKNIGWRVDHILATPTLSEKSTDSFIDVEPRLKDKPSDHTPLVAEFNMETEN